MTLTVVLGIVMVAALLTYFGFSLEKEHSVFRLFLFVMVFILLMIVGQASLTADCEVAINQTNTTGNLTSYTYMTVCEDREDGAASNFFKAMLWLFRIFITYVIMFMGWQAIQWLMESYKRNNT